MGREALNEVALDEGPSTEGPNHAAHDSFYGKESLEVAPEAERFEIDGIDRLPMADGLWTIVRGKVNGQPKAIVLDPTHPPEFMLPTEPASESEGLLNKLSRSFLGRALFALGGAMAAAACTPQSSGNSQGDGGILKGGYGTHQAALTEADADNFGPPTLIPWTDWGDQHPNIREIDGQKVFTFTRAGGNIWYVDCADFADCLDPGEMPVTVVGITPFGTLRGAIYQDGVEADKIAYGNGGAVVTRTIGYNGGGVLEAFVPAAATDPLMDSDHLGSMEIDGVSHLTWESSGTVIDRDMSTDPNTDTVTAMTGANQCGVPHQDGAGVAIGSKYMPAVGTPLGYRCHLIQAPDLASLAASVNFLNTQNVTGPPAVIHDRLINPRVFENYLIYARYDENPPGSGNWEPRMYYAVVQEYCGNGVCAPANGEDAASCPADCVAVPAEVCDNGIDDDGDGDIDCADGECIGDPACAPGDDDAGPGDDDAGPGDDDAGPGDDDAGPGDDDAGPGDDDAGPGDDDAGPGDDDSGPGDDDAGPGDDDAGPGDDDSGTPPPEEVCNDGIDNNEDGATDCADPECEADPACEEPPIDACDFASPPEVVITGDCLKENCDEPGFDIVGQCSFEVYLGGDGPLRCTLDGAFSIELLENGGRELLQGSVECEGDGTPVPISYGSYGFGPEGTIWGVEEVAGNNAQVYGYCVEGRVRVTYNGEEIDVLETGESATYEDGTPVENSGDDDSGDQGDNNGDGGVDGGDDGGCACNLHVSSKPGSGLELGMILLGLAAALRRRKSEKS